MATSVSGVLAATRLDVYVDGGVTSAKSVDAKQTVTSTTIVIPKTAQGGHWCVRSRWVALVCRRRRWRVFNFARDGVLM